MPRITPRCRNRSSNTTINTSYQVIPSLLSKNTRTQLSYSYFPAQLVSQEMSPPPPTFWTSRGHTCLPFFPPVRAFVYVAHRVQHSYSSPISIELCQLALSALLACQLYKKNPIVACALTKSTSKVTRVTAVGPMGMPVLVLKGRLVLKATSSLPRGSPV